MPLEDANDPNVQMRWQRMKKAMQQMHVLHACALQVALAQNMFLPTDGSAPMASGYVATDDADVVTYEQARAALIGAGVHIE